jgi:hypothetical protein
MSSRAAKRGVRTGLVGLFGHTFATADGVKRVEYQFRVVRGLPPALDFDQFVGCSATSAGAASRRWKPTT